MTAPSFTESVVEQAALAWLEGMGCLILSGPEIAPGEMAANRRTVAGAGAGGCDGRDGQIWTGWMAGCGEGVWRAA